MSPERFRNSLLATGTLLLLGVGLTLPFLGVWAICVHGWGAIIIGLVLLALTGVVLGSLLVTDERAPS